MRRIVQSKKLQHVRYDVRGPILVEAQRLEAEGRGREESHAGALHRAVEELEGLRRQLEQLGEELTLSRDQVASLAIERDDANRQVATLRDELERSSAERLEAQQREIEELRAAHLRDLAQLGEEFDALRHERDVALSRCDDLSSERDRLAALGDEPAGALEDHLETGGAGPGGEPLRPGCVPGDVPGGGQPDPHGDDHVTQHVHRASLSRKTIAYETQT